MKMEGPEPAGPDMGFFADPVDKIRFPVYINQQTVQIAVADWGSREPAERKQSAVSTPGT
jgi:hypothetical protein